MASIKKIGNKHRVQIRRSGHTPITKTFDTAKEASDWAITTEAALLKGENISENGTVGVTVAEAVDRYLNEGHTTADSIICYLKMFKKHHGKKALDKLTDQDIYDFVVFGNRSPSTGTYKIFVVKALFKIASGLWKYRTPDILKSASKMLKIKKKVGASNERDRRATDQELTALCNYFDQFDTTGVKRSDVIMFCVHSAMRISEVCRLTWGDLHEIEKTAVVRDRKHPTKKEGNHQIVPTLDAAMEIIQRQKKDGQKATDKIFDIPSRVMTTSFFWATRRLGIVDLHLHDLRHEATSRLFEMGYQIQEVAMFTGHRDWKQLKRYTNLKAKDLRRLEPAKVEIAVEMDTASIEEMKKSMRAEIMEEMMLKLMNQQKAA